jgi:hypothetical protein
MIDPGTWEAIESNPEKRVPGFVSTHEPGLKTSVRLGEREESGNITSDGNFPKIERTAKHVFLHVA